MKDSKQEYNLGAEGYQRATQRQLRKFAYEPTLRANIPDLKSKRVIDIACGEGISSRIMLNSGAREIVGVDISEELIEKAQAFQTPNIRYHVRDAIHESLKDFGKYDVVTAIMYLHYASSKDDLKLAIKNIGNVLTPDGLFYGMTVNPNLLREGYQDYGIKITPMGSSEGSRVKTELHSLDWEKFCEFSNYHWSQKTYDTIFQNEGFETKWHKGIVSDDGIKKFGNDFWKKYKQEPIYWTMTAKKVKISK